MAKAPWHLWLVGIIAVLFNSVGVFDFVMNIAQGPAYMESAGMTPAQIAHYQALPSWMMLVWGVGVWGAFLGSVLLLVRKKLSAVVFAISLSAFAVNLFHMYVLSDGGAIMGKQMAMVNAVIATLLLAFTLYAFWLKRRGVLR